MALNTKTDTDILDYVVVGSGFGGSVAALRLAQKGYSVVVLEEGKRYLDSDFKSTNMNLFRFLWLPRVGCTGFQRVTFLRHAAILGASGVGGGSINYANTLLRPPKDFFTSDGFPSEVDWEQELDPYFQKAFDMMRPTTVPTVTEMDRMLQRTATTFGRQDTWYRESVAVYYGDPDVTVADPYFDGSGPDRTGCNNCAGCMIGCRTGAKNSLPKNYLWFAEDQGAVIIPETRVVDLQKHDGIWQVSTERSTSLIPIKAGTYHARNVVLAAGVIGTLKILSGMKLSGYPISDALGSNVRTNSESLIGVRIPGKDMNLADGVAITSGMYLNDHTHIEVVRYPEGANAFSAITTLLTEKKGTVARPLLLLAQLLRHPIRALRALNPLGWARQSVILLVMQTLDNRISLEGKKKRRSVRLASTVDARYPSVPVYIPEAYDFAKVMAEQAGGQALSNVYEVLFDSPLTAHILGGCGISTNSHEGVLDTQNRLHGDRSLMVTDASAIPANLGVNPALTILAFAERAMGFIPEKADRSG